MLSEIETDCDSLHGRKLLSVWRSPTTTLWHINAGKRGAVHPIKTNPGGPAVRDGYGGAAQRRRNLPPPLATTCSSHPSDFLIFAVDDLPKAVSLIPAAHLPPMMTPIAQPALATGEISISSNAPGARCAQFHLRRGFRGI